MDMVDMARGLLMLDTMVDMAAVMEAMAEAMVMDMESNFYIRYIFHLSSKLIPQYKLNKLGTILNLLYDQCFVYTYNLKISHSQKVHTQFTKMTPIKF